MGPLVFHVELGAFHFDLVSFRGRPRNTHLNVFIDQLISHLSTRTDVFATLIEHIHFLLCLHLAILI